jgi:hypothetical protein
MQRRKNKQSPPSWERNNGKERHPQPQVNHPAQHTHLPRQSEPTCTSIGHPTPQTPFFVIRRRCCLLACREGTVTNFLPSYTAFSALVGLLVSSLPLPLPRPQLHLLSPSPSSASLPHPIHLLMLMQPRSQPLALPLLPRQVHLYPLPRSCPVVWWPIEVVFGPFDGGLDPGAFTATAAPAISPPFPTQPPGQPSRQRWGRSVLSSSTFPPLVSTAARRGIMLPDLQ